MTQAKYSQVLGITKNAVKQRDKGPKQKLKKCCKNIINQFFTFHKWVVKNFKKIYDTFGHSPGLYIRKSFLKERLSLGMKVKNMYKHQLKITVRKNVEEPISIAEFRKLSLFERLSSKWFGQAKR